MKAPGENPAQAKQNARDFVNQKVVEGQRAQGQTPENTAAIDNRALDAVGDAIHTATDGTSPAHVDASGNPRDWSGIPVTPSDWRAVSQHESEEATPTDAQMDNAVRAAQAVFEHTFGGGLACRQATGSEIACQ